MLEINNGWRGCEEKKKVASLPSAGCGAAGLMGGGPCCCRFCFGRLGLGPPELRHKHLPAKAVVGSEYGTSGSLGKRILLGTGNTNCLSCLFLLVSSKSKIGNNVTAESGDSEASLGKDVSSWAAGTLPACVSRQCHMFASGFSVVGEEKVHQTSRLKSQPSL